jgi:hypothetical protein
MFAMVCLTAVVAFTMWSLRVYSVRRRHVHVKYFKVMQGEPPPDYVQKPSRHFMNLFETPVLFYAVCLTAMISQTSDNLMLNLGWLYVALRIAHAAIHIGPNVVLARMAVFIFSLWTLLAMWILVVTRVP